MTTQEERPPVEAFADRNLRGARFLRSDLSGVVMRGVVVAGMEVDSPWLLEGGATLVVNGVDVAPLVDAELNRRFPGRELRQSKDPEGLREGWSALERTWAATVARAEAMPAGTLDASVAGEWSFAQTLRHLVTATDTWLTKAVLGQEQPFSPLGQPHAEYETDGFDLGVFSHTDPTWEEVTAVRADRQAAVRAYLAQLTPARLAEERPNPWSPQHAETVWTCLQTILEEEWEHHRYAVRDLDVLEGAARNS